MPANQSRKKTLRTLPIIAFRKSINVKQIIGTNTVHNNDKLMKTKNNHHKRKCIPCNLKRCFFAVNNSFQQQHQKVIKRTKRLNSTLESTVKTASAAIY